MAAVEVVISKTRGGIDVPRVIIKDIIGNRELTRKVAERARRVSAPEVQFVLTFLIEEIYEQIMEGKKVVIDGLAAFSPRYHDDFLSVRIDPSRKFIHQVARNVLHAVTATKVDACQRTCNLAVLVAE